MVTFLKMFSLAQAFTPEKQVAPLKLH
jgi:hypothetical protein